MGALNRALAYLYNGVSQQPATLRHFSQGEEMDNIFPTAAEGLSKRPPLKFKAWMSPYSTPENGKAHFIFRDDALFALVLSQGVIQAYNVTTGASVPVVEGAGSAGEIAAYLNTNNCIDDIGLLTVADTTWVWNRTRTVSMAASAVTAQTPKLYVYVAQGVQETTYSISLGAYGIAAYTSGTTASSYYSTAVATGLKNAILALAGTPFNVSQFDNLLVISRTDNSSFLWEVYDTRANTALVGFLNRVERYSDLPRKFQAGVTIEVRGAADGSGKSAYWVTYKLDNNGTGYWEETVAPNPGEPTAFDASTMPHSLVYTGSQFVFSKIAWNPRLVGSTAGNTPVPSFVGGKIGAMFFLRNRLGLLSDENAVMTRANSLYNFWPKSAVTVYDDDPIDIAVTSDDLAILRHAVPYNKSLLLFSDRAQFQLSGGEVLSPKTARCDPTTKFDCSSKCVPIAVGKDIYFAFEHSSDARAFSGVRQYYVESTSVANDALDLTAHVPRYIPKNAFRMSASSTADVLVVQSKEMWNRLWVYKTLWNGEEKAQSAWFTFTFQPDDKVLIAELRGSVIWLIIQRHDGLYVEYIDLQAQKVDTGLDYQVMLDRRQEVTATSGDDVETAFVFGDLDPPLEGEMQIVLGPSWGARAGQVLKIDHTLGAAFLVKGNWTAGSVFMGVRYKAKYRFSQQYMKDREGNTIAQGRLQLKHMTISFRDTANFRAEVTMPARDLATYVFTGRGIGLGSILGKVGMSEGKFTFPVASRSDTVDIALINDSPYPSCWQSAEWEGLFSTRTRR